MSQLWAKSIKKDQARLAKVIIVCGKLPGWPKVSFGFFCYLIPKFHFVASSSAPGGMWESLESLGGTEWDNGGSILNWQTSFIGAGSPAPGHPGKVSWPYWDVVVALSWGGQFLLLTVSWKLLEFLLLPAGFNKPGRFSLCCFFLHLFSCSGASGPSSSLLGFQAVASQKADVTVLSLRIEDSLSDNLSGVRSPCWLFFPLLPTLV